MHSSKKFDYTDKSCGEMARRIAVTMGISSQRQTSRDLATQGHWAASCRSYFKGFWPKEVVHNAKCSYNPPRECVHVFHYCSLKSRCDSALEAFIRRQAPHWGRYGPPTVVSGACNTSRYHCPRQQLPTCVMEPPRATCCFQAKRV